MNVLALGTRRAEKCPNVEGRRFPVTGEAQQQLTRLLQRGFLHWMRTKSAQC